MNAQLHHNVIMKPAAVAEWRAEPCKNGTGLMVGTDTIWLPEDWKEFARLWSGGVKYHALVVLFGGRGYGLMDVENLTALLLGNPHVLTPIERALFVLGGLARRVHHHPAGYWINGAPARAAEVVQTANRVLRTLGLPQVRYPSAGEA